MAAQAMKKLGEDAAARYLRRKGMKVLARNWRCRTGELDLVAAKGGTLVFVEVKCRASRALYDPALAVDARKRAQVRRTAAVFLAANRPRFEDCRFDVVSVTCGPDLEVVHIPDAFE